LPQRRVRVRGLKAPALCHREAEHQLCTWKNTRVNEGCDVRCVRKFSTDGRGVRGVGSAGARITSTDPGIPVAARPDLVFVDWDNGRDLHVDMVGTFPLASGTVLPEQFSASGASGSGAVYCTGGKGVLKLHSVKSSWGSKKSLLLTEAGAIVPLAFWNYKSNRLFRVLVPSVPGSIGLAF
jgi:hypothetical protein